MARGHKPICPLCFAAPDSRAVKLLPPFVDAASVQPEQEVVCPRCGSPLGGADWLCATCLTRSTIPAAPPPPPEEVLETERVVAYEGWMDTARLIVAYAGSPGFLILTNLRLVFVRGLVGGEVRDAGRLEEELGRRGGFALPLKEIADAAGELSVGGGEVRFAVRMESLTVTRAYTFILRSNAALTHGMRPWCDAIVAVRAGGSAPKPP